MEIVGTELRDREFGIDIGSEVPRPVGAGQRLGINAALEGHEGMDQGFGARGQPGMCTSTGR